MARIKEMTLNIYSNFMKFTFSNVIFNMLLIIIENIPILIIIDYMFGEDVLSKIFSPLYFISPTIILEMINEKFTNECDLILNQDGTYVTVNSTNSSTSTPADISTSNTAKPEYLEIKFFGKIILTFKTNLCLYSNILIYFAIAIVGLVLILFIVLGMFNCRKSKSVMTQILTMIFTNFVNIVIRPFSIVVIIILLNKPIMFLYKNSDIKSEYYSSEIMITIASILFLILFCLATSFYTKYINNAFYFERFPHDYYSQNDALMLLIIKIFIALHINFERLIGIDRVFFIDLILGLSFAIRAIYCLFDKNYLINNIALKILSNFFALFFPVYILLKLINKNFVEIKTRDIFTLVTELGLIAILTIGFKSKVLTHDEKFIFQNQSDFLRQTFQFMYYVHNNLITKKIYSKNKNKTANFIDNIIIGHKMKCCLDECILCPEDIYNPDLKTFYLLLYQQFLKFEKEIKEKQGEICSVLKILFLKVLDEKKIHRISFYVLKISHEIGWETYLKINYIYCNMLDEINKDLKNLITIKYSETYDDLFKCIGHFEDIITYVKSRTEKVEIVINKTNEIGASYQNIVNDLLFLKNNKRIYFDSYNLQQLLCLIKLIFDRDVHTELMENLEKNFADFLENIDAIFEENRLFIVRYDFSNSIWKIKKVPMVFLEFTKFKASELIDQNVEKIFPHFLGRLIVKRFQDLILASILDQKLNFKTYICDAQKNVRYVRFVIDVVPNFENNYILLMECHFHTRNILIADEFGNLINGSEELYNKVGINSEAIAASRGKLNMYSVFNVPKNIKLEEVKVLHISEQLILNTARNVFLVEQDNQSIVPKFLSNIMNDENKKKKNEKIYIQVYETITVNDVKFYVYYFRLDKKGQKLQEERVKTLTKQVINDKITGTIKKESFSSSVLSDTVGENRKTINKKLNRKTLFDQEEGSKKEDINYFDYYNLYYDTNHSASVTINNHKKIGAHSFSSQNISTNSDLFSFLYFKNSTNKRRSSKFQTFLNIIYFFNFLLFVVSLAIIFYMLAYRSFFYKYLDNYRLFNKVRTRIYSATSIYLSMLKTNQSESDYIYNQYIEDIYSFDKINFDSLIKQNLKFHSENILLDLNEFEKSTYNFFGDEVYNTKINYKVDFIFFNSIANYFTRQDELKNALDLFSLTSYELANIPNNKIYFNISYLSFGYENPNELSDVDISKLTVNDYNYFQKNINLYQFLYNYFSVYSINLDKIKDFFENYWKENVNSLSKKSKALLIGIIVLHILFVLVSFSSIILYKKILLKEFNTLYSINEDHIIKLKDKFKNIKGLIKAEQLPSKIYQEIRKLKENEAINSEKKKNLKKPTDGKNLNKSMSIQTYKQSNSMDDQNSIGAELDPFLKYSGAKAALVRSATIRVKSKIEKIKKETKQVQASIMLLQRLNFKFDLVNKFVIFIVFMCVFYISAGILIFYLLTSKINQVQTIFKHSDLIYEKNSKMYNYYIAVKLSIIFNKLSPYTQNVDKTHSTFDLLRNFNNIRDELIQMESNNSFLSTFYDYNSGLNSDKFCTNLYTHENDLYKYIESSTNPEIITHINLLCGKIPIMKSNVDSVFANINIFIRQVNQKYLMTIQDNKINDIIKLLQYHLIDVEILFTLFAEPYFSYIKYTLLVESSNKVISQYFTFIIIIFVLNLFIDCVILIYLWVEIYKKIISSVNNIHLVTESVSMI